jgi:outer membrane protein with beta-barrel domain
MRGVTKGVLSICLGLALGTTALAAQAPVQFGLGGGASVPSGSTSDGLKTGWHGTALVEFKPVASPVGFRIDGNYNQLNFEGGGGKDRVIDGTANAVYGFRVSPETKFRPYLIGGGGIYNVKAKPDIGPSPSNTKFGINGGAGFNLGTSSTSFFVEGRFHNVFFSGPDFHFIPITAGVRFGGSGGA